MSRRIALLAIVVAVAAIAGCIRVEHLGKRTGRSFNGILLQQTMAEAERPRWARKPMEAELATVAVERMVGEDAAKTSKPAAALLDLSPQ